MWHRCDLPVSTLVEELVGIVEEADVGVEVDDFGVATKQLTAEHTAEGPAEVPVRAGLAGRPESFGGQVVEREGVNALISEFFGEELEGFPVECEHGYLSRGRLREEAIEHGKAPE